MADQKLIDEVGKYIDKYYEPVKDDIKMDKEMKSIFDKITKFRKKRAEEKALKEEPVEESSLSEESLQEEFDVSTMQKTKRYEITEEAFSDTKYTDWSYVWMTLVKKS